MSELLDAAVLEAYANGASTSAVGDLVAALGIDTEGGRSKASRIGTYPHA